MKKLFETKQMDIITNQRKQMTYFINQHQLGKVKDKDRRIRRVDKQMITVKFLW